MEPSFAKRVDFSRFLPLILTLCLAGCADRATEPLGRVAQSQTGATLRVGPELPVDDPVYTPSARHWNSPGIAWNGAAYLVVSGSGSFEGVPWQTLGWRLDASAQPLDPLPFALPGSGPVTSNGSDYLMTYPDQSNSMLRAARISSAGIVLDPTGLLISTTSSASSVYPAGHAVASNGTDYLAVWTDSRNGNEDIYGARISASGQVLDASGFPISNQAGSETKPAVAWDGARYVVVWDDRRSGAAEVFLAQVTSAGRVAEPAGLRIAPGSYPAIASDGTNSLVVWDTSLTALPSGVNAARVTRDGSVFGAPFSIRTGAQNPRVAWTGSSFATYYLMDPCRTYGGIGGTQVSSDGTVLSVNGCTDFVLPEAVAGDGTGRHVLLDRKGGYSDYRDLTATAYASDRTSLGSWIATAANIQLHPQIAHDANRYFIAWHDLRATDDSEEVFPVYGARIGADGTTLDRSALSIDPSADFRGLSG